jgi:hypothetical protein
MPPIKACFSRGGTSPSQQCVSLDREQSGGLQVHHLLTQLKSGVAQSKDQDKDLYVADLGMGLYFIIDDSIQQLTITSSHFKV